VGSEEEAGCVCAGIKRLSALSISIMRLIRKFHLYFGSVFSGMGYTITVQYHSEKRGLSHRCSPVVRHGLLFYCMYLELYHATW
jgi:hypothetical protein